jgi:hypothetical protein
MVPWVAVVVLVVAEKIQIQNTINVIHSTTNQTRAAVVVVVGYDVFRE